MQQNNCVNNFNLFSEQNMQEVNIFVHQYIIVSFAKNEIFYAVCSELFFFYVGGKKCCITEIIG